METETKELLSFEEAVIAELWKANEDYTPSDNTGFIHLCNLIQHSRIGHVAWMIDRLQDIRARCRSVHLLISKLDETILNLQKRVSAETCGND